MRCLIAAVLMLFAGSSLAHAQEACSMEMNVPKLTLTDMWTKASAKAKAWKADAVPARITNTSMGPLDEAGKSEAWNLMFFSPSANASVTISTFRGMFTCYAQPGPAGRLPDLTPEQLKAQEERRPPHGHRHGGKPGGGHNHRGGHKPGGGGHKGGGHHGGGRGDGGAGGENAGNPHAPKKRNGSRPHWKRGGDKKRSGGNAA